MSNYDLDLVWARMSELEKRISALEADSPREPRKLHRTDDSARATVANHARLKDLLPLLTGAKESSSALRGLGVLLENWYARCAAVGAQCTRAQLYPDILTHVRLAWAGTDDTLLYVELPEGAEAALERLAGYVYRDKQKFPFKGLAAFRAHATEFFDLPQERVEEPKSIAARFFEELRTSKDPGLRIVREELNPLLHSAACERMHTWCTTALAAPDPNTATVLLWRHPTNGSELRLVVPRSVNADDAYGHLRVCGILSWFQGFEAFRQTAAKFFAEETAQERAEEPMAAPAAPTAFAGLSRTLHASAGTPDASRLAEAVLKGLEKPLWGLPTRFGEPEMQWARSAGLRHALCLTWHWKSETYRLRVEPLRRGARWDLAWCATDNGVFASSRLDSRKDILRVLRDAFARENARSAAP